MPTAIVRPIPASFAQATVAVSPVPPIDVARARVQHAAYVAGLAELGLSVVPLPAADALPDSCFVEDCALYAEGVALLTRSGAASRRGEVDSLAPVLAGHARVERMEAPATLDGGDCLRVGRRIFIGRSARSNDAGVARVREVFGPLGYQVTAVPLPPSVLHLKCVCAPLGDGRVLVAEGALPAGSFGDLPTVTIPAEEAYAANVLAFGGGALVSAGFPRTHAVLEAAGIRVRVVETSEFRKADGALTCLSILLP